MAGSVLSNRIGREELKPGDHIYSWRSAYIYSHHGIYIGDQKVIHFTWAAGQTSTGLETVLLCSSPPTHTSTDCRHCAKAQQQHRKEREKDPGGGVIISCLDCFLDGGNLYRFLYSVSPLFFLSKVRGGTCTMASSDPTDVVLHRAVYLLNHGFGTYSLFKNNCEDFAIYCKTGLLVTTNMPSRSGQINSVVTLASIPSELSERKISSGIAGFLLGTAHYFTSRYFDDIGIRKDVVKVPVERVSEITQVERFPATEKSSEPSKEVVGFPL